MRKNVCIFCSSSNRIPQIYMDHAKRLGEICAEKGINIINGAGSAGLMGATSNATLEKGGTVTGVIPEFMVKLGWEHKNLTHLIVTKDMAERKNTLRNLSDGIITMAGGCGTMEELWETITCQQLQFYPHPIIVLNTNGFFEPIKLWWEKCKEEKFLREGTAEILYFAETPEEAIQLFLEMPDVTVPLETRTPIK